MLSEIHAILREDICDVFSEYKFATDSAIQTALSILKQSSAYQKKASPVGMTVHSLSEIKNQPKGKTNLWLRKASRIDYQQAV